MKLIVCVDDNLGMAFNHRRQSKDRNVKQYIADMSQDVKLYIDIYSLNEFSDVPQAIADADYLNLAGPDDYCFAEVNDLGDAPMASEIILIKWNKVYPSDLKLGLDMGMYERTESEDIVGYSHDKITIEHWRKL